MKVECGSCAARYAIADEKIAGRVFKIRCKKCQSAIVVRGDQVAAPARESVSSQSVWHVVVDGTQDGPFDAEALAAMHAAGTIDDDAFVWREGWADWKAMREVDELAPPEPSADTHRDDGADLFGQAGASPFAGDDDVVTSAPSARPSAQSNGLLTGSRNESSVLFSLSNLSALSTGPSRAPEAKPASVASTPSGRASGEGSGLIDIRALSGMAGGLGSAPGPITATDDRVDALLAIGGGSPLAGLAAPVLAPAEERADRRPVLLAGLGVAGLAVVAAAAVAMVFLTRPSAPMVDTPASEAPAPERIVPPVADAPVAPPSDPAPAGSLEEEEAPQPPVASREEASPDPEHVTARAPRRPRTHAPTPAPETARAPARATEPGDPTLSRLLDSAIDPDRAERPERARPAPSLAATPGRSEVVAAMNRLSGPVRACGDGAHGNATVAFAFGSDGAVRSADVTAADLPPAVRSCVAQAARSARVPPFAQSTFRVVFPFRL